MKWKYVRPEHERRFLLAAPPADLDLDTGFRRLEDLYLDGTRVRLRTESSPAGAVSERKLTQKLPDPAGNPVRRILTTFYLDAGEHAVFAALPGRPLAKRRYAYACDGRAYCIDVFEAALAGLVLAEIELESERELQTLPLPPFAHCEVTELPLFTGGELSQRDPAMVLAEARKLLATVVR